MKWVIAVALLLITLPAAAQQSVAREYGSQTTVDFCLYTADGSALNGALSFQAADCLVMKDEGAEAQCTNSITDEGTCYSLVLTGTEMQAARIMLIITDAVGDTWLDKTIRIETYNSSSGQHNAGERLRQ